METSAERKLGLQFTETMKGFFVRDPAAEFHQLESRAPDVATPFQVTLTIQSDDLKEMLTSPSHQAGISGTVSAPALCPEVMSVASGIFNLFIENPEQVQTRNMRYRFGMAGANGSQFYLDGIKVMRDQSIVRVWHDTTTLYITLYQGADGAGQAIGRGILKIEPQDFATQLTTVRVTNAASKAEELKALAEFGSFFAGALYRHYGGVFAGPTAFNPNAPPRAKRPLRAGAPELYPFLSRDGVTLQLTRYRGGNKGPVIVSHGLGVSSLIYSTDTIDTNLLEFLFANGYDVWLLDFRASIILEASQHPSDGDEVARMDYPAAVAKVREITQAQSVQCVVHCWGATTFFMAMLAGLEGVRSFVSSQMGLFAFSPPDVNLKTGLRMPEIFEALGIKRLDAAATTTENWWEKICDQALKLPALALAQGWCNNATCHRITVMYASLYNHAQLNELTHENLHEMFGVGNMRSFEHIAAIGRAGRLVDFYGHDTYLPRLDRLNLPIAFIHGGQNRCFLPEGTQKTFDLLCSKFDPSQYTRQVIPGYGHIDCIFGKNAAADVYPFIVQHLDKTNGWTTP
jgi:cholesterol oxidase